MQYRGDSGSIRMSDVARRARVSTATVSRVLAGYPHVSTETRQRVLQAIEDLQYHPNRLARSLRRSASKLVVVILPDITNPFFSEIVKGLEEAAAERGFHVLLGNTGNSVEREQELLGLTDERFVDGVILATARLPRSVLQRRKPRVPLVMACEYVDADEVPTVAIDNRAAARDAVERLIAAGHRRIACVTGPMEVVLSRDRLQGYLEALRAAGITPEDRLIVRGDWTFASGYAAAATLFAYGPPPTALFCSNDEMALGCMKWLQDHGLHVPADVSVVGFDDIPASTWVTPELTTVRQPKAEIGRRAMSLLLDLVEGRDVPRLRVVLPHEWMDRGTVAPPRADAADEMSDMG